MDLINVKVEAVDESNCAPASAELNVQQLHDLELCLIGGGMGDVLQ